MANTHALLFKLAVASANNEYFHTMSANFSIRTQTLTLAVSKFLTSNNSTATAFALAGANGYYELVINGAKQQTNSFNVSTSGSKVSIHATNATGVVLVGSPISLNVVGIHT
jgi:hypothetical protein